MGTPWHASGQHAASGDPTPAAPVYPTGTPASATVPPGHPATAAPSPTAPRPASSVTPHVPSPTAAAASPAPASATPIPAGPISETPPGHYVVLIVVDAGRPDYVMDPHLPHIGALMAHGTVYSQAYVGELESSTPDVHVTYGTGTEPRENGFMGFGWAAPDTRRQIDFRTLLAQRRIDPVLQHLPLPSVAARLHQFHPNAKSLAVSGHKDYAVVGLGGGSADFELYGQFVNKRFIPKFLHGPIPLSSAERASLNVPSPLKQGGEDSWAFRYAALAAQHVRPRLLMINLPEMDTWGHWYGPGDSAVFHRLMRNVDRGIGLLEKTYRQLGILNRTDFIVTADHGMMNSIPARNWGLVSQAARDAGTSMVRGDTEGGAVWLQDPTRAQAAAERLVAMHPAHVQAILYRSAPGNSYHFVLASPAGWLAAPAVSTALQRLVNTTAGQNGPDMWVLYREDYSVVPRNVKGVWHGTHGGATWKVQHVPLIISGPDIRHTTSLFAARAIDIAPTIERLLGLPPVQRDGVILADALTNATLDERSAQGAVRAQVDADVRALQIESAADERNAAPQLPSQGGLVHCGLARFLPKHHTSCSTSPHTATNQ